MSLFVLHSMNCHGIECYREDWMTDDIYMAPESALIDESVNTEPEFYVVSPLKFGVLFFVTMGIYSIYWFYKNWWFYKHYHGEKIWPVPRGIFSIFFTHSLFKKVDATLKKIGGDYKWDPVGLASMYVLFAIASNALDRMAAKGVWAPYGDILSLLILFAIYWPLARAQRAINVSQQDADGRLNSNFSFANYLWILFGALLWVLVVIGVLATFGLMVAGE